VISRVWAHHKNLNADRPIMSAAETLSGECSFYGYKGYADIRRGSGDMGHQTRKWSSKMLIFISFACFIFRMFIPKAEIGHPFNLGQAIT